MADAQRYRDGEASGFRTRRRLSLKPDPEELKRLAELVYSGATREYLQRASPVKQPQHIPAKTVLEHLFPNNPLVCTGQFFYQAHTQPLSTYHERYLRRSQFVVPSPMTSERGVTLKGDLSARSEGNVGPRRWAVVEADPKHENPLWANLLEDLYEREYTNVDLGAAMLMALADATRIPFALVVFSGGVSLHGWFPAGAMTEDEQERFYATACRMGADPAHFDRVQWTRMPNGLRWTKVEDHQHPAREAGPQSIEYFNPQIANPYE